MAKPLIQKENDGSYYALIANVEDGYNHILHGYKGRYFKTFKAALKSTTNYINKHKLKD